MKTTYRKTKIIATLGPSSSTENMVGRLMDAGADIFRLNFSHGSQDEKKNLIAIIRSLSEKKKMTVGILADLQGPKIRTGRMADGAIRLVRGEKLDITTDNLLGRPGLISTIYKALPNDVKPGSKILLDDGMIELKVTAVTGNTVHCSIVQGGILKDLKGINLPGVAVSAPSLSEKDRGDLEFCMEMGVDFIALSFVRQASDVTDLKEIIHARGLNIPIVAKIEKPEALRNFSSILAVTDAVMVARGDLGVELSAERVPLVQKEIIRACNEAGKPVITATQMLESMILHSRPTRAETSDVANAILDGTDAVMLSGETASGAFPIEAVRTMVKIALDIEHAELWRIPSFKPVHSNNIPEAVAEASCRAASTLKAKALVVFTQSGNTAALISKFRPQLPIIAFTPFPDIQRRLTLFWGVKSLPVGSVGGTKQQIKVGEDILLATGFKKGDLIVVSMGVPIEAKGSTNLMKVHRLGAEGHFDIF